MSREEHLELCRREIQACIAGQHTDNESEKLGAMQGEMDWRVAELDLLEGRE